MQLASIMQLMTAWTFGTKAVSEWIRHFPDRRLQLMKSLPALAMLGLMEASPLKSSKYTMVAACLSDG